MTSFCLPFLSLRGIFFDRMTSLLPASGYGSIQGPCMIPLHRIDSPLHHPPWPSLLIFLSPRILPFLAGMLALGEILDEKFTWREMLCKGSNTKQYNTIHILCLYALLSSRHTRALARTHTHTHTLTYAGVYYLQSVFNIHSLHDLRWKLISINSEQRDIAHPGWIGKF